MEDISEVREFESNFVGKVDQYLKNFPGKKLVSFDISFGFHVAHELASHVDNWISFAVRMEAERIKFNILFWPSLYTFPCHLLPLGGGSHLKFLCLHVCKLRPPPELVNRFSSLKSLELDHVNVEERDMDVILSGCINLESLVLRNCYPILSLRLESYHVPQLKWLAVLGDYYDIQNIELNSVRLERFEYKGQMELGRFNFCKLPPLTEVFLWFSNPFKMAMDYMFECLPRDFPVLQNLTLCWFDNMVAPLPARMTAFGCLKHLHLILILTPKLDLLSVTYILNASPVLEEFHLSLHDSSLRGDIPKKEYSSGQYLQLREVTISRFRDRCNAVQLAVCLLKNALALERMIINRRSNKYHGGDEWMYCNLSNYKELTLDEIHGLLFKQRVNPTTQLIIM